MSISIDEALYDRLKHAVPSKYVSRFVTLAITKELSNKEEELKLSYLAAQQDKERNIELEEWDQIND